MDHTSVSCHPAQVTFPPLPQPVKTMVLDLATREERKAELASASEVDNFMRYINLLTYLLTYLVGLNFCPELLHRRVQTGSRTCDLLSIAGPTPNLLYHYETHSGSNFRGHQITKQQRAIYSLEVCTPTQMRRGLEPQVFCRYKIAV